MLCNTINGEIPAVINKITPIIKVSFWSSIIPDPIRKIPKKPSIIGIIWENIIVPVIAIYITY